MRLTLPDDSNAFCIIYEEQIVMFKKNLDSWIFAVIDLTNGAHIITRQNASQSHSAYQLVKINPAPSLNTTEIIPINTIENQVLLKLKQNNNILSYDFVAQYIVMT